MSFEFLSKLPFSDPFSKALEHVYYTTRVLARVLVSGGAVVHCEVANQGRRIAAERKRANPFGKNPTRTITESEERLKRPHV